MNATVSALSFTSGDQTFRTDRFSYLLCGTAADAPFRCEGSRWELSEDRAAVELPELSLRVTRTMRACDGGAEESIEFYNYGEKKLRFSTIKLGWLLPLQELTLHAIPFTVQQDGWRHMYSAETLRCGEHFQIVNNRLPEQPGRYFGNSVYSDPARPEPPLCEEGLLRSEAWFWGTERGGLLAAKYNNRDIEYAVAEPVGPAREELQLGGAGFCLYHEPSAAQELDAGQRFRFGSTFYYQADDLTRACGLYRALLDRKGHALPSDYAPKVHWNELYDIGWYHSDRAALNRSYTLPALLREAQKAHECGCGALYLDPGWEFAEGTTFFDYHRLGDETELVKTLREQYGLSLAIRIILRTYVNYWPDALNAVHTPDGFASACMLPRTIIPSNQLLYEQCLCNEPFRKEKERRADKLAQDGAYFIMLDEMDWRGPCYHPGHGHARPSTAYEHADAVCRLAKHIKNTNHIQVEVHDPVWPWNSAIYTPSYWRQGFSQEGSYQENWGFEFMWDCIEDLRSGRALSLYYYNLSCSIPLYLHINMAADNDQCLFFWWAASTVRHLGIGGKNCDPTIVPPGRTFTFDPETRFAAYRSCMQTYNRLRAYYQRGVFTGISEFAHLHTLADTAGGVLDLFNCTDEAQTVTLCLTAEQLHGEALPVTGAEAVWDGGTLTLRAEIPALSHRLVLLGGAAAQAD